MKMWKQWMALLMIFCLLMPGALAGSIDLTDDLDEEVGSVTESSAGEDYTISDNGDIILDDDDDLGGDVFFDDDGSTIEITDNEIDDTIDPDKLDINANLPSNVVNILARRRGYPLDVAGGRLAEWRCADYRVHQQGRRLD